MYTTKSGLLIVFFSKLIFSLENSNNSFIVVSTTPNPSEHKNQTKNVQECDCRFSGFETQFTQIQKTLEDLKKERAENSIPKNCKEVQLRGFHQSNIYLIQPKFSLEPFLVLCDMKTRSGGWTYIVNRISGNLSFDLTWNYYKEGFGNLADEFWIGLDKIHYLTGYGATELLVGLTDWVGTQYSAYYSFFGIGNEREGYALKLLGEQSGDTPNTLNSSVGNKFSTKDKDQDPSKRNCASEYGGGWWYEQCDYGYGLLTRKYNPKSQGPTKGVYWTPMVPKLMQLRMMVRPKDVNKALLLPHEDLSKFL